MMFRPRPFDLRWQCQCCGMVNHWLAEKCGGPLGCCCSLLRPDPRCPVAAMFARLPAAAIDAEVAA